MKRILSGTAAALLLGMLSAAPASADSWTEGFAASHSYGKLGGAWARFSTGRGTNGGRSNLGAMTSSDGDDRPVVTSRRSSRASAARGEGRAKTSKARSSRSGRTVASRHTGGGSSGIASYYWQPQRVASGGWFNPNAMTAAHKTLPFGTKVRVTNVRNGRSTVVTINDRGPYVAGRIIDLSKAAAGAVGMIGSGIAQVRMEVLGR